MCLHIIFQIKVQYHGKRVLAILAVISDPNTDEMCDTTYLASEQISL